MRDQLEEAERIKERLRSCASQKELRSVADEEREAFLALRESGGIGRVMAIQISNLKSHMKNFTLRKG